MITKSKLRLNPKTLAAEARVLSRNIDTKRWQLAELAAQAKAEGVEGWAEIIGAECRRQPRTVRAWAAAQEWVIRIERGPHYKEWRAWFPYSFYEVGGRYSETLGDVVVLTLMFEFKEQPDATLESFRTELATLSGSDDMADFRHWVDKEKSRILGWIDRAPSRRAGDCLRLAADALSDALTAE